MDFRLRRRLPRRLVKAASALIHFWVRAIGLALASPSPKWTEKEESCERNVETKPDRIDDPESHPGTPARGASGNSA